VHRAGSWCVALAAMLIMAACTDSAETAFQGWVEANLIFVAPDETGRVETLPVREGDVVAAGQQLFAVDEDLQQADVHQNKATLINAQVAFDRAEKLLKTGSGTVEQRDQTYAALRQGTAVHERDLQERPQDYAEITRKKLLPGAFIPAVDYVRAQQLRTVLCAEFAAAMRDLDAVITLSSLDLPCRIDDAETIAKTYERQCRMPFNVTGTPAIAVPTGFTAAGLPTAMQIVGRAFAEPMVYRVAHAYCAATGWCERHPPVKAAEREKSLV